MTNDFSTESLELANLRLRLRDGLTFELQENAGVPCYVIKNAVSSSYYRVGVADYALISLFDGKTSLQDAVRETSYRLGEEAMTIREALSVCHWLIQSRLADPVDELGVVGSVNVETLLEQEASAGQSKTVGQLNPLFIKLPLGDPTRLISVATKVFGWIGSCAFLLLWIVVVCVAVVRVWQDAGQLRSAFHGVVAVNAWWYMLVTFVGMKIIHEFAHGIICHRFGGRVKEAGIVFILLMPMPYVDVTSCWGMASKWRRIAVSAAGMYIEVFLAALAAIAWTLTSDPELRFHLFNVVLTGSITTLLFNANFLMRFDGYYILSDWLAVPNLYQSGQQFLHGCGKRYLLGMSVSSPAYPPGRATVIRAYGVASFVWRVLICVSLSILASAMFYGFGLVLALLGVALWLGLPLARLIRMSAKGDIRWARFATTTVPAVAGLTVLLFVVPWPVSVSAPALVQYREPVVVRIETPGFVSRMRVLDGQQVAAGDVLVELDNRELTAELRQLQMQRQSSLVRSRGLHGEREIAAYQAELAKRDSIETRIEELTQRIERLTVRAEAAGSVVISDWQAGDPESLQGRYLAKGQEILKIVDERRKEVLLSVSQDDFQAFTEAQAQQVKFSSSQTVDRCEGQLQSVEPHASVSCEAKLTTSVGGPLSVRPIADAKPDAAGNAIELVHPRFRGIVALGSDESEQLRAGIKGTVKIDRYPDSIAVHLAKGTRLWVRNCLDARDASLSR